jgi:hypothetical protein
MRLARLADLLAPRRPVVAGANSSSWSRPPLDPVHGVEVPFVCGDDDGSGSLATWNRARVTQCALSRICGVCGAGLDRTLAFLGTSEEESRRAFHLPPLHIRCADALAAAVRQHGVPLPGQAEPADLVTLTCAAFEFVRPTSSDPDRRPVFTPVP